MTCIPVNLLYQIFLRVFGLAESDCLISDDAALRCKMPEQSVPITEFYANVSGHVSIFACTLTPSRADLAVTIYVLTWKLGPVRMNRARFYFFS
jgi:hypothetical protein